MKPLKKRISALLLLLVAVFSLAACEEAAVIVEVITPEIQGLPEDLTFTLKTRETFDPMDGVVAFDGIDGIITDQVIVLGVESLAINDQDKLTKSGSYTLTYFVINSTGQKTEVEATVVITDFFEELANYEVGEYSLVWSDEFNYIGTPDPDKWNQVVGGSGFGNNEIQYYTDRDENSYVDGEHLTITMIKEEYSNRNYTSAKLTSHYKASWKYAKIEISAKMAEGKGTWPALWMMPEDSFYGGWPRSGEIDLVEHVGYQPNQIYGTIHTNDYNGVLSTQRGGNINIPTAITEFHTYTTEWLPDKIIWSVDGVEFYTYSFEVDGYSTLTEEDYWEIWPYDQEFYLIMNLAMGGNWGGAQGIDETLTGAELVIDYVRVYQASGLTE